MRRGGVPVREMPARGKAALVALAARWWRPPRRGCHTPSHAAELPAGWAGSGVGRLDLGTPCACRRGPGGHGMDPGPRGRAYGTRTPGKADADCPGLLLLR